MSDIKLRVMLEGTAEFEAAAKRLDDEVRKLGKGAGAAGAESKSFGQQLTGNLIPAFTAATLAADVIRGGFRGIKNALSETIGAAIAQEDADSALRASLELTGRTVAGNYEHYKKFAEAQQLVTKFADDEVQAAQNLLLQMTRLDQQGIDRATKGAMGLASVFKMDLQAAASLVQKAMEGNFGALGRYGIRVKETGALEEKRADLLRQLDGLYGRATAATGTFSGKVGLLKNAWGEAQEEIGKAVTQNKGVQDLLQTVMNTLREFTPEIKEYVSGIAGFLSGIASVTKATLEAIDDVRTAVGGMRSDVSEADAAWDNLSKKLGGFSGIVTAVGGQIKRIGQYSKESRDEAASLGEKLWASFNEVGERATLAAIAAGKFGKDAQAAFKVVGGEGLKLAESLGVVKGKVNEVGDANKNLAVSYKLLDTAMDAINWGRHRGLLELVNKQLYETTTVIEGQLPVVAGYSRAVDDAAEHVALLGKELKKLVKDVVEAMSGAEKAQIVLAGINDIVAQGQRNREIGLDNEYKKRLAIIEATIKDEDAKQKAIMALEAEFELKKSSARRKWATAEKAAAISQAYINASLAATKVLGQTGLFGIPLVPLIWGLCLAQIALIAAQPIPLAGGALFKKRTLLPAQYEVAEAGSAEIVSPVPMMRRIVREEMGGRGAGNCYITLARGAVTINAQTLGDAQIQSAGNKIFREMEAQARLRGFKLRNA